MGIANLKTLEIFKKARLRKDGDGGAGSPATSTGGAITTSDLAAGGGLMVPEQGGRKKRLQNLNRKMRKPVRLGKTISEVQNLSKAKDAGGHGSEKRGGREEITDRATAGAYARRYKRVADEAIDASAKADASDDVQLHANAQDAHERAAKLAIDRSDRSYHDKQATHHQMESDRLSEELRDN